MSLISRRCPCRCPRSPFTSARQSRSAGSSEIEGLLPWRPTTVREFGAGDRVTVFGRIYQDRRAGRAPVRVDYRIRDEDTDVVRRGEDLVPADRFAGDGGADWRVELPVSELSPCGPPYLLEVEARLENRDRFARQLRFQVHRR